MVKPIDTNEERKQWNERNALASQIYKKHQILSMCDAAPYWSHESLIKTFKAVCLSHERLRMELEGAEAMLRDEKQYSSEKRAELRGDSR